MAADAVRAVRADDDVEGRREIISGGISPAPQLYPQTVTSVASRSMFPARAFFAALSLARRSRDLDPPSLRMTREAPRAAHAMPTTPVPDPSSTTEAPRRFRPAALFTSQSHRTALELHTLPPVPYPPDQPGASMSRRRRSSVPEEGRTSGTAAVGTLVHPRDVPRALLERREGATRQRANRRRARHVRLIA